MFDGEFEVCFELLLSVILEKSRRQCGLTCKSQMPGE
jgi:hypothetical protein